MPILENVARILFTRNTGYRELDGESELFCHARLTRKNNNRCGNFVRRYADGTRAKYCSLHGGRNKKLTHTVMGRYTSNKARIMRFYSKSLGPTLTKVIAELQAAPMLERMRVDEEIALARATLTQTIQMSNLVFDPPRNPTSGEVIEITPATKALVLKSLQDNIASVVGLVEKAARIEALSTDKLSLSALDSLCVQITRIIADVLGDSLEHKAIEIEQRIASMVRMPLDAMRGIGVHSSRDGRDSSGDSLQAPAVLNVIHPALPLMPQEPSVAQ